MRDIRIYIAEQRGETVSDRGLVRSTLNYGNYSSQHREPIDSLVHLNEWIGYAGQTLKLSLPQRCLTVFIPLKEEIILQSEENRYVVPLGSVLLLSTDHSMDIWIDSDPEENHFAFQQLVFSLKDFRQPKGQLYDLPIVHASDRNKLLPIFESGKLPFQFYIGAFVGKEEYTLTLPAGNTHALALTLDGNFEVEQRILFPEDKLYLPNFNKIEVECLSETGLLALLHF